MLRSVLHESVFCEQVRVVGKRGLDELARSRTLPALVWERMAPLVAAHEDRLEARSSSVACGRARSFVSEVREARRRGHRGFWRFQKRPGNHA